MTEAAIHKFIRHLKRYVHLYHPSCRVEILPTDRYTRVTGKSELAVYATVNLDPFVTTSSGGHSHHSGGQSSSSGASSAQTGDHRGSGHAGRRPCDSLSHPFHHVPKAPLLILNEMQGAMAQMPFTWIDQLDREAAEDERWANQMRVEKEDAMVATPGSSRDLQVRKKSVRDFSIVTSERSGQCLYLGPGRFINHDCHPNVQLMPSGNATISFRVIRPIRIGDEITAYYGPDYFGRNNDECLCRTCERLQMGWFAKQQQQQEPLFNVDSTTTTETEGECSASAASNFTRTTSPEVIESVSAPTTSQAPPPQTCADVKPSTRTRRVAATRGQTLTSGMYSRTWRRTLSGQELMMTVAQYAQGRESPATATSASATASRGDTPGGRYSTPDQFLDSKGSLSDDPDPIGVLRCLTCCVVVKESKTMQLCAR